VVHRRFYWLEVPEGTDIQERANIVATVSGQTIRLQGDLPAILQLRLSDRLLNLDEPVAVIANDQEVFQGTVTRCAASILQSLAERADAPAAATALLRIR
jgi:hypothetical protein